MCVCVCVPALEFVRIGQVSVGKWRLAHNGRYVGDQGAPVAFPKGCPLELVLLLRVPVMLFTHRRVALT